MKHLNFGSLCRLMATIATALTALGGLAAVDAASAAIATPAVTDFPVTSSNFDGLGQGFAGPSGPFAVTSVPPDPVGAVGPNHYVQAVNDAFAVFDKTGNTVFGPAALGTLWAGSGDGCSAPGGSPSVQYDSMADRWVIVHVVVGASQSVECVAVSITSDPAGPYAPYAFTYPNELVDSPRLAIWPDGYYVTFNVFKLSPVVLNGSRVCAYDRAKMILGAPATQQCFDTSSSFTGLLAADLDGTRLPLAGAPERVVGLGATNTTLAAWKVHLDWLTPTNSVVSGPTTLTVDRYDRPCPTGPCVPQNGGGSLDAVGDRLMNRLAYRNFADGHQALVASHAVAVGTSVGERWYELRPDANNDLSVFQQGTYALDSTFRWMGSVAQDQAGNIALAFSTSSATSTPAVRATARLADDPPGLMPQGEATIIAGAGAQGATVSRWGDASQLEIDPVDDCTFWYTNEYIPANGIFNWRTRIAAFKMPGCGVVRDFSLSTPPALSLGIVGVGNAVVDTAVVRGGSEPIALSVTGLPAGATASFTPASVPSGSSSTLTVSAGTAAPGTYTVTITGTGSSASHSTTVSLTVLPPPDFALAISPPIQALALGSSGTYSVATSSLHGSTQAVTLSVSALPAGVTATFDPSTIVAGGHSVLTISTTATATETAANFTVTGTSGAVSRTAPATITLFGRSLPNGIPIVDLSGRIGSRQNFVVDVPPGSATLTVQLSGGIGDADLYVRAGAQPTLTTFTCRPFRDGNNETCTINAPAAGPYFIMVNAFNGYFGATLTASFTGAVGQQLDSGVAMSGLSGAAGSERIFSIVVPPGRSRVTVTMAGGSGDADLYLRTGAVPTAVLFSCRPFLSGNNETCAINSPASGGYFVMIRGFTAYAGVSLTATVT